MVVKKKHVILHVFFYRCIINNYFVMKNYKFTINNNNYSVHIVDIENQTAKVEVNGTSYQVEMEVEIPKPVSVHKKVVKVATPPIAIDNPTQPPHPKVVPVPQAATAPAGESVIKSPLPGVVLDIFVKVGDPVKPGQHIIMLEAMKMENNIDADKGGLVKEIRVRKNDSVMEGDVLIVIG
jgi:biotin carboxyl carrier protein